MSSGFEEWAVPVGLGIAAIAGVVGTYIVTRDRNNRPIQWSMDTSDATAAASASRTKLDATIASISAPTKSALTP